MKSPLRSTSIVKPGEDNGDPAFPVMAMDIVSNVLRRADNPGNLATYLTEEVRDLTGARCVLLLQCQCTSTAMAHHVAGVNPVRRREWAESPEALRLYDVVHHVPDARLWRGEEPPELAGFLRREGFELSMVFPLDAGEFQVGAMLVLGLPDEQHITSVLGLLDNLSTIVTLVLRNAILYEKQEQTIHRRTAELRDNNAVLTMELSRRQEAEEALRRELDVNKAMSGLSGVLVSEASSIEAVADATLRRALSLTRSAHGFVLRIDPQTGTAAPFALMTVGTGACPCAGNNCQMAFPVGPDGHYPNLWGHALNTREGFCTNSPATHETWCGAPDGHVRIKNFLAVPALVKDKLVGEVALANSEREYTDEDLGVVARLSSLYAIAVERARTENMLRDSELRFRRLAENARDVIYRMSLPDGVYEYMSPAATTVFGYAPEEFYNTPQFARRVVHPSWHEYFEQHWSRLLLGDMPPTYEFQIVHKSGEIRWVNQRNILVRDEGGDIIAIEGIVTDVTERKNSEEELRKLNAELEQRVRDRTCELEEKNAELQRTIRIFVGRELRMIQLKDRIRELEDRFEG